MDQVEEIKQKVNIAQLVGEYVTLKKLGRHWKGLCPFHGEKTPSFIVSEEMGIFKCFGCGKGGDAIKFLEEIEGLEFRDALEKLADRVGVKLKVERKEAKDERQMLLEVHSLAAEYYHFWLTSHDNGRGAKEYLKGRGINEKLMINFKLGYSLPVWDGLSRYLMEKKGYKKELLIKSGLVIENSSGGIYDRFRGRIMFPLMDGVGRVVGFSGRVIPGVGRDDEPKYINSPETDIYHKSRMLFGLSQVRQVIREKKRVVVVEGELDMISSFAAGVTETVAIKGSALTEEMMDILGRLTEKIILSLDADAAGEAAMMRSVEMAERRGLETKIARIIGGKDPDEIARKNPKQWRKIVDSAIEVYEFVFDRTIEKYGTDSVEAVKKITQEVVPFLAKIDNSVVKEVWVRRLAVKLGVDKERVWEEVEKASTKQKIVRDDVVDKVDKTGEESKIKKLTKQLLICLLVDGAGKKEVKKVLEQIKLEEVEGKIVRSWLNENEKKVEEWIKSLPDELKTVAQECYLEDGSGLGVNEIRKIAVDLGRESLRKEAVRLRELMREAERKGDEEEAGRLAEEDYKLKKVEQRLLAYL